MFRFFATRFHPDAGDMGDKEKFSTLVRAYETLKNPELRAAYDVEYQKHQTLVTQLIDHACETQGDTIDRRCLLSLFYAKRRQDMNNPMVGLTTIENAMNCPPEVLQFHVWYFREKGWIRREENGGFAITAEGVDQIEKTENKPTPMPEGRRIGHRRVALHN
jgi:curved DNA-binding protein CbpA